MEALGESDVFRSIAAPSEGLFKDRGSRFLAFAFPVESENQIENHIAGIRKRYHDARHHCYAWALGANRELYRAQDAGEPSGTAGKPILGQIISFNITNVLVIVVRYFGGTLLGTGGLVRAYKSAAHEALSHATIIKRTTGIPYTITFPFSVTGMVTRILEEEGIKPVKKSFTTECNLEVLLPKSKVTPFLERICRLAEVTIQKV